MIYTGGDSNDIVISQLSFIPPVLPGGRLLPRGNSGFHADGSAAAGRSGAAAIGGFDIAPLIEPEVVPVGLRYIEIRIVVPIDEAGNVREEFAMKLPAEWLADLPAVLAAAARRPLPHLSDARRR